EAAQVRGVFADEFNAAVDGGVNGCLIPVFDELEHGDAQVVAHFGWKGVEATWEELIEHGVEVAYPGEGAVRQACGESTVASVNGCFAEGGTQGHVRERVFF